MNPNEPATKGDLAELNASTKADIAELKASTKADIAELKASTKADIAELKASTKNDIAELKAEFKADLQSLENRMEGRLDVREQRLVEQMGQMIRDSETRLLSAFYGYSDTTNKHLGQLDASDIILQSRVFTLESRMMEVEKRLNIPPAAA